MPLLDRDSYDTAPVADVTFVGVDDRNRTADILEAFIDDDIDDGGRDDDDSNTSTDGAAGAGGGGASGISVIRRTTNNNRRYKQAERYDIQIQQHAITRNQSTCN